MEKPSSTSSKTTCATSDGEPSQFTSAQISMLFSFLESPFLSSSPLSFWYDGSSLLLIPNKISDKLLFQWAASAFKIAISKPHLTLGNMEEGCQKIFEIKKKKILSYTLQVCIIFVICTTEKFVSQMWYWYLLSQYQYHAHCIPVYRTVWILYCICTSIDDPTFLIFILCLTTAMKFMKVEVFSQVYVQIKVILW